MKLLHKENELDWYLNPGFPVGRRFQEHELMHTSFTAAGVYIAYEEQRDPMHAPRRRARQDEEEREQHITSWSIDYAFMTDNGDLCTREEMERVGWDNTRDTVFEEYSHWRNPCTSCLGKRKRRPVSKNRDTAVRLFVSSRIKNQRLLTSRRQ